MFYTIVRYFYVGDNETHSVQQFTNFEAAQIQHYRNVAADLDREGCVYQASLLIRSDGAVLDSKVFDRRALINEQN